MKMGETLWAWVVEEEDGSVGLIATGLAGYGMMPLIGRSEETIRKTEPFARRHGELMGCKVWLRRYALAEEIGR
jgi:hypothetical protein